MPESEPRLQRVPKIRRQICYPPGYRPADSEGRGETAWLVDIQSTLYGSARGGGASCDLSIPSLAETCEPDTSAFDSCQLFRLSYVIVLHLVPTL